MHLESFLGGGIGIDLIYSFVIVLSSLLIYYSTKEIYELTGHKGVRYFRLGFLFFALSYAFRFFAQWCFVIRGLPRTLQIHPVAIGVFTLILFLYASTAGIFYLWTSVHWKKIEKNRFAIPLLHLIAIGITLLSVMTNNIRVLFAIQLIIIVLLASTIHQNRRGKKNLPQVYVAYILLAFFWMLNVIDLLLPNFFQTASLLIYLASIGLFIFMLYKVVGKSGG